MNPCTHTVAKNVAVLTVIAAMMSALTPLGADPLPVEKKANAPGRSATPTPAKKAPVIDYAESGNSITGSHLPMPVHKDRGRYYVDSAFSARQVTVFTSATTGLSSRPINMDEVSNVPTNHSKNNQAKKKQDRHQPAANTDNRQ